MQAPGTSGAAHLQPGGGVNPVWLAQSRLRRRKFDECIEICTSILEKNPVDQVGLAFSGVPAVGGYRKASSVHEYSSHKGAVWTLLPAPAFP